MVLVSTSESLGFGLRHTLLLALVTNQGTDRCDLIDVVEWRYQASSATGEIERTFDTVRSFEATFVDGEASLCQN